MSSTAHGQAGVGATSPVSPCWRAGWARTGLWLASVPRSFPQLPVVFRTPRLLVALCKAFHLTLSPHLANIQASITTSTCAPSPGMPPLNLVASGCVLLSVGVLCVPSSCLLLPGTQLGTWQRPCSGMKGWPSLSCSLATEGQERSGSCSGLLGGLLQCP